MRSPLSRTHIALLICAVLIAVIVAGAVRALQNSREAAHLPYYVAAEELDPIFAIEGTDPDNLRSAVEILLSQRDQIAKLYPTEEGRTITDAIYPASFLNDLSGLEEARQTLIAHPSVGNATAYHGRLTHTIDEYAASARTLSATLKTTAAQYPTIGYLGGLSSTTAVAAKLQTVADAALSQKEKEDARYACLTGASANCTALTTLMTARSAQLQTPARLPAPGSAVHAVDALTQQIFPLMPGFDSVEKPLFAISSDCYQASPAYLRAYYLTQAPGAVARKLAGVNDAYFYDIPKELTLNPNSQLDQALVQAGVHAKFQSAGNLYMCPDSGLDVTQVGSLVGVLSLLRVQKDPMPEVRTLLSLPVVQKADLAPYLQTLASTSTPEGNALIERYIEGSANFDQVILGAYNDNRMFILAAKDAPSDEYAYMLIARNFASALFLMGNPTFMPQPISLFSTTTPNAPQNFALRSYLHDASRQFTDRQLVQQTQTAYTIDARFGF